VGLDLVVSGATGHMGRTLGRLIDEAGDLRALGGIAPSVPDGGAAALGYPEIVPVGEAAGLVGRADAVIDFSAPDQLAALLVGSWEALAGRALLVGTTGLGESLEQRLDELSGTAAVLVAANFSVGINLLLRLVERAAGALPADRYDIEVVEAHHRRKEDAPSGTALALGEAAARGRGMPLAEARRDGRTGRTGPRPEAEIGFHAVRGGGVAGEHTVHLLGDRERITLGHIAHGRELFAEGALVACRWMAGREPGRYTMDEVLGPSGT
jgi:4-hydroxy-tetrahydrodipicolinate reductase